MLPTCLGSKGFQPGGSSKRLLCSPSLFLLSSQERILERVHHSQVHTWPHCVIQVFLHSSLCLHTHTRTNTYTCHIPGRQALHYPRARRREVRECVSSPMTKPPTLVLGAHAHQRAAHLLLQHQQKAPYFPSEKSQGSPVIEKLCLTSNLNPQNPLH